MLKKIALCLLFYIPMLAQSQNISILLYAAKPVKQVSIEPVVGQYKIYSQGKIIGKLRKGEPALLVADSLLSIRFINKDKRQEYNSIELEYYLPFFKKLFHRYDTAKIICITPTDSSLKARLYEGGLSFTAEQGKLKMINSLPIENYLPGVVEAEVGPNTHLECYKAQSIICRTYAFRNINKHASNACNLCDDVHCQAYKGISNKNANIHLAVNSTAGMVAVSQEGKLINALFSANCGGQTANSEDVWSGKENYLRSIVDPHCTNTKQAKWEKTIPTKAWVDFLKKNGLQLSDTVNANNLTLKIPNRQKDYKTIYGNIPYTKLRSGFGLKSAYFNVEATKDMVKLSGFGYGHGVGMCQEGAMAMAQKGFSYEQIIQYYFTGIKLQAYTNMAQTSNTGK